MQLGARVRIWLSALGVSVGEYLLLGVVLSFAIHATASQALPGHPARVTISSVATLCALLAYVTWGPGPARNPWVWGEVRLSNAVRGLLCLGVSALARSGRLYLIPGRLLGSLKLANDPLALTVYVLAPIIEELLFRGILLRRLNARMGFWPALAVSSAVFATGHPNPLLAFAQGAALGYLYSPAMSANLLVPVVCHIFLNLTSAFETAT